MAGFLDIFDNTNTSNTGALSTSVLTRPEGVDAVITNYEHFDLGTLIQGYQEVSESELDQERESTKAYTENSRRFQTLCRLRGKRVQATANNQTAFREYQATLSQAQAQMVGANAALAVTNTRLMPAYARMENSLNKAQLAAARQMERLRQPVKYGDAEE